MPSRIPPLRRFLPVLAGVFIISAGVGALGVEIFRHRSPRQLVRAGASTSNHPRSSGGHRQKARSSSHVRAREGLLSPRARARFAALAAQLPGRVGLAVAPLGNGAVQTVGDVASAPAWSTSKVLVLVTLLRDYQEDGRALSRREQLYATTALEQSDNAAIEALFGRLEQIHGGLVPATAALQAVLKKSGDDTTSVNAAPNSEGFTTYGQTRWSVGREVIFYRALATGCLLDPSRTSYVLRLMRSVVPYQRWGAGSAGYPPSVPVAFKGGWGPTDGRYQVRQTAIVGSGHRGYVLSLLALPDSGAFEDGVSILTALARWAGRNLPIRAAAPPYRCGRR